MTAYHSRTVSSFHQKKIIPAHSNMKPTIEKMKDFFVCMKPESIPPIYEKQEKLQLQAAYTMTISADSCLDRVR